MPDISKGQMSLLIKLILKASIGIVPINGWLIDEKAGERSREGGGVRWGLVPIEEAVDRDLFHVPMMNESWGSPYTLSRVMRNVRRNAS